MPWGGSGWDGARGRRPHADAQGRSRPPGPLAPSSGLGEADERRGSRLTAHQARARVPGTVELVAQRSSSAKGI